MIDLLTKGSDDEQKKKREFEKWTIKSRKSVTSAATSLGSLSPSHPFLNNNWMRDQWGVPDQKYPNINVLNASLLVGKSRNVYDKWSMKLKLDDDEERMYIVVSDKLSKVLDQQIYFDYSAIRNSLEKHTDTILVNYKDRESKNKDKREFFYDEAYVFIGFDFEKFLRALRNRQIQFDLRFGTKPDRRHGGRQSHNRGNCFRAVLGNDNPIETYGNLYDHFERL